MRKFALLALVLAGLSGCIRETKDLAVANENNPMVFQMDKDQGIIGPEYVILPPNKKGLRIGEEIVLYSPSEVAIDIEILDSGEYSIFSLLKGTICKKQESDFEIKLDGNLEQSGTAPLGGKTIEVRKYFERRTYRLLISYKSDCFVSQTEDGNLIISELFIQKR